MGLFIGPRCCMLHVCQQKLCKRRFRFSLQQTHIIPNIVHAGRSWVLSAGLEYQVKEVEYNYFEANTQIVSTKKLVGKFK